jgi:hypothetical protein
VDWGGAAHSGLWWRARATIRSMSPVLPRHSSAPVAGSWEMISVWFTILISPPVPRFLAPP